MSRYQPPVIPDVNMEKLVAYRLNRVRQQLKESDIPLAILTNPISLRYAVDFREYTLFQSRIPVYYLFVPVEGPVHLYGSLGKKSKSVDEQISKNFYLNTFEGGFNLFKHLDIFTQEIKSFLKKIGADNKKICIEQLNPSISLALKEAGLEVSNGEPIMEKARMIKSKEEVTCLHYSVAVCEYAIDQMYHNLKPGITENQLLSTLHQVNIAYDGDWIEGRMLCSGKRTNPWWQEATNKEIKAGEFVAFDSDMIGAFGYCADISRTFLCRPSKPTEDQKYYYQIAYDEVQENIEKLKVGMSFREFSEQAYPRSEDIIYNQYVCVAHGIGMCDEYPKIYYQQDWERAGYDGIVEPNMTLCVESYVGSTQKDFGVKLEEMVLIKENGIEKISSYPFETDLLK